MKPWVKNQYLDSAYKTIVIFGGVHLLVLIGLVIRNNDFGYLNLWRILDFELLLPGLGSDTSFLLGIFLTGLIYLLIMLRSRKHS